ncbi:MAG: T9SS C-terminal target domain-containing protein, partial [Bacteroidetes bacterium]
YNPITHHVNGDSLFIITLADGAMRKLKIDRLASGVFTFTHAQLDGSDEVEVQLRKSDFPNKHFAYYSFAQDSLLDLDPEADSWDLLFSRYQAELAPGVFYPVTGVRTNFGVEVAEVRGVDVNSLVEADTANYPLSAEIDVIGYDWKSYSPPAQQWTLADSTAFLVAQADGEVHKLVFTGFGGSANGNFEFEQQTLTTGLFDWPALSLSLFPNPATDRVSIRWGAAQVDQIQVLDLAGRALMTQSVSRGDGEMMLSLGDLPRGLYLVRLIGQEGQGIARIHLQ